jgi:hypothetical protein
MKTPFLDTLLHARNQDLVRDHVLASTVEEVIDRTTKAELLNTELLEALKELLDWNIEKEEGSAYVTNMRKPIVFAKVQSAITKAEGKE